MTTQKLRLCVALVLVAAVAAGAPAPAADPSPPPAPWAEPAGQSNVVVRTDFAGMASYRGVQVMFMLARLQSPTNPRGTPGSTLLYVPPVDLARDAAGRPLLSISDPATRGPGLRVAADGKVTRYASAAALAEAVWDGVVPPATEVLVRLDLQLDDSEAVKREVWRAYRTQLSPVEGPALGATPATPAPARLAPAVLMLPPRELTLECDAPGLVGVMFKLPDNPNLGRDLPVTAKTTAGFVAAALGDGVALRLCFKISASGDAVSTVTGRAVAEGVLDVLLGGSGDGKMVAAAGVERSEFSLLTTRRAVDEARERLAARRDVVIRGASAQDVQTLLELLKKDDPDLLGCTALQLENALNEVLDVKKLMSQPGVATLMSAADTKEELTDQEAESFLSSLHASGSGKQSSGGASFLGIGAGGGSGSWASKTDAEKKYARTAMRHFLRDLKTRQTEGRFPVSPKLDYRLVSTRTLAKAVDQTFVYARETAASARVLSSPFHTNRLTLGTDRTAAADARQAEYERLQAELDALGGKKR